MIRKLLQFISFINQVFIPFKNTVVNLKIFFPFGYSFANVINQIKKLC